MINPEGEVQTLSLTSVRPPTDELKAVLAAVRDGCPPGCSDVT